MFQKISTWIRNCEKIVRQHGKMCFPELITVQSDDTSISNNDDEKYFAMSEYHRLHVHRNDCGKSMDITNTVSFL